MRWTICVGLIASFCSAGPRQAVSTAAGTRILGPTAGADWGRPVTAGDFDDDGYDDLVVVASESFGGTTSTVHILRGGPGSHGHGLIDLATTSADLVITGAELDDNLGASVATGDVNGDGMEDLLLAASTADHGGVEDCGVAYLLYGGPAFYASPARSMATDGDWDVRFVGPFAFGDMGGALLFGGLDSQAAAIGNLNGDAFGDVVLGVHLADGNQSGAGRVYVRFGANFFSGFTINFATASQSHLQVWGAGELDELGTVVATGDITGDGIDELILPTQYASEGLFTSEGAVHMFRGRSPWPRTIYNLATATAEITLRGARQADELGEAAATGDFNGDGIGDLAVGASGHDAGALNTQIGEGIVYGLLGDPAYQTGTHVIDYQTDQADFTLTGESQETLGTLVAAGDFNGDGISDLAVPQRFGGPNVNGIVEVLLGRDFTPGQAFTAGLDTDFRITGLANDRIGFWLAAGNTNGDGLDEIMYSTPFNNGNAGTAYIHTYVSGDADFDGDVDIYDLGLLQPCVGEEFFEPIEVPCVLIDFTLDEQVDGADLAPWLDVMTGPG